MRAPIGSHCICASSQINRFADVAADSPLVRCRGRAAILVVLATFGVVCHAQMPRPDASGVTRCEIQLASCQAVLGKVGAREADGLVPRAAIAIVAETGTPSSASKGARLRSSPIACQSPACTSCLRKDARRCTCVRGQSVPLRVECARRQEHERRSSAGRHRAASRVERNELRSSAAGVSRAQQCTQAVDQPG